MPKVSLIAYTQPVEERQNPMSVVEEAASVCYNSAPTRDYKIAKGCYSSGHTSVWEHISFTFHIQDVSRALLAELTRHRLASFSVRSQRYCAEDNFDVVIPKWDNEGSDEIFGLAMETIGTCYKGLVENGEPREDARMVLPNACVTEIYMTMNARELMHASNLRLCNRAQWEIRGLFRQMKEEVAKYCPEVAERMVPTCEKNKKFPFCTESRSCGKHPRLSEVYQR